MWNHVDPIPAILKPHRPSQFEGESFTALEYTAKNAAKVNELVEAYNKFIDEAEKLITDFTTGATRNEEVFRMEMAQKFQDFIDIVELKYDAQNLRITETVEYLRSTFATIVETELTEMFDAGEMDEAILNAVGDINNRFTVAVAEMAAYRDAIDEDIGAFKDEVNKTTSDFIAETESTLATISESSAAAIDDCNLATSEALNAVAALNLAIVDMDGKTPTDTDNPLEFDGGEISLFMEV